MLDQLLTRNDVESFIKRIKTSERYYKKNAQAIVFDSFCVSSELALYIFYDALLKYKIVVDDIFLFDEYLEQLEKLYKKLNDFEKIRVGVNKLIGKMVALKLRIKDLDDELNKKQIISFIYNRYILNGYLIHGMNSLEIDNIKNKDFVTEEYDSDYAEFQKINKLFAEYNVVNVISKDFNSKKVYFTDDAVKACYYSSYAPMFFYQFLINNDYFDKRIREDIFLKDDYDICTRSLKRFMQDLSFKSSDRKYVNDFVKQEWDKFHYKDRKITFMLVKRSLVYDNSKIKLESFLDDSGDLDDVVDRLLSSKCGNVSYQGVINNSDIEFIELDNYYDPIEIEETFDEELDKFYMYGKDNVLYEFNNVYGKASIFIILGSLFISFGVILTIFMVLRGM